MQKSAFDTFIDDLITEKGFINLTQEMREDISVNIKQRLDEYIIARSLAQFSEEEMEQFKNMLDEKKTKGELRQFAADHVADYPTFLTNTIAQFREAYLS
jgi:hypothetical protein